MPLALHCAGVGGKILYMSSISSPKVLINETTAFLLFKNSLLPSAWPRLGAGAYDFLRASLFPINAEFYKNIKNKNKL